MFFAYSVISTTSSFYYLNISSYFEFDDVRVGIATYYSSCQFFDTQVRQHYSAALSGWVSSTQPNHWLVLCFGSGTYFSDIPCHLLFVRFLEKVLDWYKLLAIFICFVPKEIGINLVHW